MAADTRNGIDQWVTTIGGNLPVGTTVISTNLDDNLDMIQVTTRAWAEDAEWLNWGDAPTFISTTSFSVPGDKTARYLVGRRIKMFGTVMGTFYGRITASVFSTVTTVTVAMDSGALTSNLSKVFLSIHSGTNPSVTAANVRNVPAGNISATTVQAALDELDTEKASLASPALTGNPTAPTPATSDNDTSIATTAFVTNAAILKTIVDAKGDLITASAADTPVRLAAGSDGQVLLADSSAAGGLSWSNGGPGTMGRNIIMNSRFELWQRGATIVSPASNAMLADRWVYGNPGAGVGVVTISRSTDVPTQAQSGIVFNYSLHVDVTTADASIASGDLYTVTQIIEGYIWAQLAQRACIVSFWVKSPKTGTHCVSLRNSGLDRSVASTFTVNSANTWEFKTVSFAASPSAGSWDYTNGIGVRLTFTLAAGTGFHSPSPGVWVTGNYTAVAGVVNVMDNTANNFFITGIQLETGTVATNLEVLSFGDDLRRCQRYYQKSFPIDTTPAQNAGSAGSFVYTVSTSTSYAVQMPLPVMMRVSPTMTFYNPQAANANWRNYTDLADSAAATTSSLNPSDRQVTITNAQVAGDTVGDLLGIHWAANAELQ